MLFNCYFQFQPRYFNGEISCYEALLRTNESDTEYYVENNIDDHAKFDLSIIEYVIKQRSKLIHSEKIKLAINISISSLLDEQFLKACLSIFEYEGNIILELTRHDVTNNVEGIQASIKQLKSKGVQLALDDYGKGYANSELFLHLDVDYIKLDRKIIKNIDQSYIAYSLVKTTYEKIAKVLGKNIIVEGVETFEQLNLLKQFGCMTYQGFYFSKPLNIEQIKPTNNTITIKKKESSSLCNFLDQAIYEMNRAPNPKAIKKAIKNIIKIDRYNIIGISPNLFDVYSEQRRINKNYNELLERKTSSHFLLVSSLMSTCNALVIIRDCDGNAIYNNENHINYLGVDLVDYTVEQTLERFPDYRTCLDLDKELLNSDTCFVVSNETVDTDSGKQYFHTYRQKIIHFNQAFVICSVYEQNDNITVDNLTGCFQKSYLESTYARAYQTLVFMDLDGFKLINDLHGHNQGDEVLRDFAKNIKAMLRDSDAMVRFGGDEFVVLLDSVSIRGVKQRIETIRANIEAYFWAQGLNLSFSYGIVSIEDNITAALDKADQEMYKQKNGRKNQLQEII
ncbi:Cyclic di-GMP phosphodiesterase Gmr [Photobacterium malacitanum]|uniref:Cyclic di-GMP phosphodiesterase Gmr n=1 Tax=Photobacterium malacitanum TaxID=2204294 RepID=A0A1Y6MBH8_9GAMM|nr:GGDEF domain-containing protein [Photobacterium malacitanum]SMY33904.1 Cyclic di-GMP phosphodiesterase Gmr [Photobacterium malacitanum]